MPLLKLQTSVRIDEDKKASALKALSKLVAEGLGKPESYVMVTIDDGAMIMAGETGPAAFAVVRSIGGLNPGVNAALSKKLCAFLTNTFGIPGDRVYINFANVDAESWGWNGGTF